MAKRSKLSTLGPTSLYRHYDKDGILLYVGISLNFLTRTDTHSNFAQWWNLIATIKVAHYASRDIAEDAERRAIINEKPIFNITYSTDPLLPRITKVRRPDIFGRPRWRTITTYPKE